MTDAPGTRRDDHDDFGGLHRDLAHLLGRRRALAVIGGAGLAGALAACGLGSGGASGDSQASTTTTGGSGADPTSGGTDVVATAGEEIPDETAGPYPSDGSNGPNVLAEEGIVRSDLTSSIGSLSGTAEGVPLTVQLTVVDAASGAPLPGAALYLWHCTAEGRYSMYEVTDQNYLRGVQVADDGGRMAFTTVFPGCYRGRWPHLHFEVFDDVDAATAGAESTKTSQMALPQADCEAVYADDRYGDSSRHLGELTLAGDMVFADGWQDQLATVSGTSDDGYTASLLVRI